MKLIHVLLLSAIVWTQVTPPDDKGCAGYTPTIVNESIPDSYQHSQNQSEVDIEVRGESNKDLPNEDDDYEHSIGDNKGHGQFDSPSSSEENQW